MNVAFFCTSLVDQEHRIEEKQHLVSVFLQRILSEVVERKDEGEQLVPNRTEGCIVYKSILHCPE